MWGLVVEEEAISKMAEETLDVRDDADSGQGDAGVYGNSNSL